MKSSTFAKKKDPYFVLTPISANAYDLICFTVADGVFGKFNGVRLVAPDRRCVPGLWERLAWDGARIVEAFRIVTPDFDCKLHQ